MHYTINNLLRQPAHAIYTFQHFYLDMSEPSLRFTLSTIYRLLFFFCVCCFFKPAPGMFRDLKENLGKICEGNINI